MGMCMRESVEKRGQISRKRPDQVAPCGTGKGFRFHLE